MISTFVSKILFRGPQHPQIQQKQDQQPQQQCRDQHTPGWQNSLASASTAYLSSNKAIPSQKRSSEKCIKTPHSRRPWSTQAKSSAITEVACESISASNLSSSLSCSSPDIYTSSAHTSLSSSPSHYSSSACVPSQQPGPTNDFDRTTNPIRLSLIRATNFDSPALTDQGNASKQTESLYTAMPTLPKMDDESVNDKTGLKEAGSKLAITTNSAQDRDSSQPFSASLPASSSVSSASASCTSALPFAPPESATNDSINSQNTENNELSKQDKQMGQTRMSWLAWFVQPRSTVTSVADSAPTQALREPEPEPDNTLSANPADDGDLPMDAQGSKETNVGVDTTTEATPRDTDANAQQTTSWLQKWTKVVFPSSVSMAEQESIRDDSSGSQHNSTTGHSEELTGETTSEVTGELADEAERAASCETTDEQSTPVGPSYWKSAWSLWTRGKSSNAQSTDTPNSASTPRSDTDIPAAGEQKSPDSMGATTNGNPGPVALPPGVTPDKVADAKKPMTGRQSKKDSKATDVLIPQPLHDPNQVLPSIKDTFKVQERPPLLKQISRLFMPRRWDSSNHVTLTQEPPLIKRAVAIGVHGYFPVQILRKVLGPPTGTSHRFATMAAKAITQWAEDHGTHCTVTKIPLEGEGRISERVELLWTALLSYIDDVKNADFVLVACHSQGVPVTTMLVSKLIDLGCIEPSRIGICAMAGVNSGPFIDYRSRLIGGAAGELFEFSNPTTMVSKMYAAALEHVLGAGSRITYIGSLDDQLVPLESSVFSCISHPYIYRAVFVNGRVHSPSFLSSLFGFIMKLRNLGISDHGLIRELSTPVAGNLYSGEGHSRLYDNIAVYRLAVEFALESLPVPHPQFERLHTNLPGADSNPYILPFIMRGVLEEDRVRREMADETTELLKQFESWKPSSKVLKDVKFRLEGIRSKL